MKDIKGLTNTRGEENHSWWDHVSLKAGKLMPTRLRSIQKKLEETSLEEFKKWFVS